MMRDRGFTLVEVLVAAFVLMIVLLGVAHLFLGAYQYVDQGEETTSATSLAQQRVEWLRNQGYGSADLTAGNEVENLTGIYEGYVRTTSVADDTPVATVKQVTVTVQSPSGHSVSLVTLVGP